MCDSPWDGHRDVGSKTGSCNPPLPVGVAPDDHGVPQGVHLGAAAVHGARQPRVDGPGAVAVAVAQQLLVDAGREGRMRGGQEEKSKRGGGGSVHAAGHTTRGLPEPLHGWPQRVAPDAPPKQRPPSWATPMPTPHPLITHLPQGAGRRKRSWGEGSVHATGLGMLHWASPGPRKAPDGCI